MMLTFREFLTEKYGSTGTYAAMKFDEESQHRIAAYITEHGIPNPVPTDKLHVTLLYSRKECVGYQGKGILDEPMVVRVCGFDMWPNQDGEMALVAELDSPDLYERHKYLMMAYGATYDFPEYKPHVTLSYNANGFHGVLPLLPFTLKLNEEYSEQLNLKWAKENA